MKRLKNIAFGFAVLGMALASPVVAQTPSSVRDLIYQYAVQGNIAQLERLKKLGYSLDALDAHENTAYCQAIWMQQRRAVATLRAAGADRRPKCLKKIPVVTVDMIYDAADDGDLDQLVLWKKADVQVDVVDSDDGNSALCKAVYAKNCKAIQTLLRAGAQETQACMRKVPPSVRKQLDCRPVEINWDLVGYTTLGIATAGGVAALLMGSGGGGGSPVCSAEQRWQGDRCVSCSTCWLGSECISQDVMSSEYYYRDETDGSCWQVAPSPISFEDGELSDAVATVQSDSGYGGNSTAYDLVNLAYAHARGYTGYIVDRKDTAGRLTDGQTSYQDYVNGTEPASISDEKVTVAVISSGTTIGSEGYVTYTNTDTSQENISSTATTNVPVWDWTDVNPHFYENSSDNLQKNASYYKNTDQGASTSVVNRTISDLEAVDTSFALKDDHPFGYNFDRGPCPNGVTENCWGLKTVNSQEVWGYYTTKGDGGKDNFLYLWASKVTGQPAGLHSSYPTGDDANYYGAVSKADAAAKAAPYEYVGDKTGYHEAYNEADPSPHYSRTDKTGVLDVKWAGTRLASIIASLNQDATNLYGVAYNAAVLPIIPDIWDVLQSTTLTTASQNADVILNEFSLESVIKTNGSTNIIVDAVSTYTKDGTTANYKPGSVAHYFGTDTLSGLQYLAGRSDIYVIPTGVSATNTATTMTHKQPSVDAAIPLLNEFNTSKTSWKSTTVKNALPVLEDGNSFKNLFVTVSSISGATANGTALNATLSEHAQPCGISASYCVVAPGSLNGAVLGTSNTIEASDLTSNSAAVVAGAVALLKGAYPHLTSQQVVEILFKTARYITPTSAQITAYNNASYTAGGKTVSGIGVYQETNSSDGKYNSIFGRGLIDLNAATTPVGGLNGLWVQKVSSGYTTTAVSTSLLSSSAMSVNIGSSLPATFTAFDAYDRPFALPTSMLFRTTDKRRAKSLSDFKAFVAGRDEITVTPSENFSMSYLSRTSTQSSPVGFGLMKIQAKMDKATFGMFYTENTQKSFGSYITRKLNNPFIQMREAYGLNAGWQFNSKWSVDASWVSGKNGFFDEDAMDKRVDLPDNQMQAFTTSVTYRPVQPFGVKLSSGIMRENNSSLGMVSSGAFDIKGAKTYFVGAGLTFNPLDNLRFDAMYYYGQTDTQQGDGLVSLGKMMSDGFALTAEYNHSDNSTLGFQFSSPLRVKSGTLHVSLPSGRHLTDDIFYYNSYGVDMSPSARELDFSLYLKEQIRSDILWQTELGTRLHPDHRSDAAPDYRAFMSLRWAY